MKPTRKLRDLLDRPGVHSAVGAHDALLARLVERAGFEPVGVSGNTVAAAHLGLPDMGFRNLSDMDEGKRLWENDVELLSQAGFKILS